MPLLMSLSHKESNGMKLTQAEVGAIVARPPLKDWREIKDLITIRRRTLEGLFDERCWWGNFFVEVP